MDDPSPSQEWLSKDSERLWRGSYKGKDWRYLVRMSQNVEGSAPQQSRSMVSQDFCLYQHINGPSMAQPEQAVNMHSSCLWWGLRTD